MVFAFRHHINALCTIIVNTYGMYTFQETLLLEIPVITTGNAAEVNFHPSVSTVSVNVSLDIYC